MVAVCLSAGLAVVRPQVQISPAAAVYQRQLSMLSLQGRSLISSLRGEALVWMIGAVVYLSC